MTTLQGLDVSIWQTPDSWSPVGLSFLVARASIGTTKDAQYDAHIAKAKAAGLVTGAYHFNWSPDSDPSTPDSTPEQQAQFFLAAAGDVDLLFLDVEGTRAFSPAESQRFIAEVHRAGRQMGVYMSQSAYRDDGQDYDWIAKWTSTPPTAPDGHWEFWQYTDGGGKLDRDEFNGDAVALAAFVAAQKGASDVGFNFGTGTATVGPAGGRICTSPLLSTALASPRLTAGAKFAILGGIAGWRVGLVTLAGAVVARWVPASDIVAQVNHEGLDQAVITGVLPAGISQAQLDAAALAAAEAQYDLDAKSIVASAKLSNSRP